MDLKNNDKKALALNAKTGEVIFGAIILTPEMQKELKRQKIEKEVYNSQYKQYGNFYWLFYEVKKELFNREIEGATIARLMYLATYIGYNDNVLCHKDSSPIEKKELQNITGLKDETYRKFIKECKEKHLLWFDENGYTVISKEYFKKGKFLKSDYKTQKSIIRVYCNGVRSLYEGCDNVSQHKALSYLFMLLPYVNRQYNIVCNNPREERKNRINFLNMEDICDIIGYSKKNKHLLRRELKNLEINGKVAFRWLEDKYGSRAIINPLVYYAGDKHSEVCILGEF